jgi:DNA-binding CsgD family transcriptional regulator
LKREEKSMSTTLNSTRIQKGETLYSYISRCHFLWGGANPRLTSQDWFGRQGVSLNQCLPTEVTHIAKFANYPVDQLLNQHTFFPLFNTLNVHSSRLKKAMLGNNGKALANASGMSQLRKSDLTASNVCPHCFKLDCDRIGVGYWHLFHQFPGVKCCYKHGCRLITTHLNPRAYELPMLSKTAEAEPAVGIQLSFSNYIANLSSKASNDQLAYTSLSAHKTLLDKNQFLHGSQIDMKGLLRHIKLTEQALELPEILNDHSVRNILQDIKHNAHPLKKLLFQFIAISLPANNCSASERGNEPAIKDKQEIRCLNMLSDCCLSMREISRRLNVSVGYIKSLAKRNNIHTDQRRQFITLDIERKVIDDAIEGRHRFDIADEYEISIGAVEHIIQAVNGLSVWRQHLRAYERRAEMRQALTKAINSNPDSSRKKIKEIASRSYMWLFKYDKQWLNNTLPAQQPSKYYGYNLWLNRDKKCLPKLSSLLNETGKREQSSFTLKIIDECFGGHGWFTRSLHKMPRCKEVYENISAKEQGR